MKSRSRLLLTTGLSLATLLGVGALVLSPSLLLRANRLTTDNWGTLSNVGQAYGGVSAILTALALIGVAASLLVQRQQAHIARTQAIRAFQLQMLTLCLEKPETYYPLMGHEVTGDTEDARRQIFATYFLNYVHAGYSIDFFDEQSLMGDVFPRFFKFDTGRAYWESMRPVWVARYFTKKSRKYVGMLDASYERAVLAGPPEPAISSSASTGNDDRNRARDRAFLGLLILGGGLITGATLGARQARRFSQQR
ncbi:DUF6082 family protein [Actinoplanes sp. RD1]|uniref:DUF6082 family protein n=1 Tax=Actinoplanes sp. RD1 TaxID=3064538 RepID=UPI0027425F75|nr:DUF6082 family protein [Actinoplanes sp. RD1]